ncbi:MAG: tetratricopeptide repeat protein, partial [Candidatus Thermoplasmatota archaeon]|nr:tetratricopeptide repeat protein [Candidatus Thermoplasmatota archaeon]
NKVPEEFIKLIRGITDGNPLFIKECTAQMVDEGAVDLKKEVYPKTRDEVEIPSIIDNIIDRWTRGLNKKTRRIFEIGSVIGEKIPFDLLSYLFDMNEFELLNHVDILVGQDIWDEEPNEDFFYFSHGLIQLSVYENIPKTIRKRYHQKIGDAMKDIYDEEIEVHLSEIAFHFERGGKINESIKYYIKAGKRAEDIYAHENAVQMYQKSLELIKDTGKLRSKEVEVLESLGDTYSLIGEYGKSRDNLKRAIERSDDKKNKAKFYCKIGRTHLDQGNYDQALTALEKGLNTLDKENWIRCRLLDRKGWALMRKGELQKVRDIFEEEKRVAEKIEETKERGQAIHNEGAFYLKKGEYKKAKKRFRKAVELRKEIGDKKGLSSSYNNLGVVYSNEGDLDNSLKYLNKSLDIVKEMGDIRSVSLTLLNIGEEYYNKGELDKALENYEESLSAKEKIDDREGIAFCHNYIGEVYREKKKLSDAKECHEKGLKVAKDIQNQKMIIDSLLSLAQDRLESNEVEKGLSQAKKALQRTKKSGLSSKLSKAKRTIGKGYRLNDEFERALEILEESLEEMEEEGDEKEKGKILYELGLTSAETEEENIKSYFKKALNIFEEIGMDLWIEKTENEVQSLNLELS